MRNNKNNALEEDHLLQENLPIPKRDNIHSPTSNTYALLDFYQ